MSDTPSDPTALTTAAVLREVQNLEEKLSIRINGVENTINARLAAIDKATDVFKEDLTRVPTQLDRAMTASRGLTDEQFERIATRLDGMQKLKTEQFESIQKQFGERDIRHAASENSAKDAIATSLAANKELMTEQAHNTRTVTDANQAQISDLKDRITRVEAVAIGQATQKQESQHGISTTAGVVMMVVGIIGLVVSIALRFTGH